MDEWVWRFCLNNRATYNKIQKLRAMAEAKRTWDQFVGDEARRQMLKLQQQLDQKEARARAEGNAPPTKTKRAVMFGRVPLS